MVDDEVTAFLESGCALIVATVGSDGAPRATRAWGLDVAGDEVLVLLDVTDTGTIENLRDGGRAAVTGADVGTFRSVQLKGRAISLDGATEADLARADRYCDDFFTAIEVTDHTPRDLIERIRPVGYVRCTLTVDELFDQTPGPAAGAPLPGASG